MECNTPLNDEELSLALDGLADDKIRQHLAECLTCAGRLAKLIRMDEALTQRLSRFECPSPQHLADYQAGMLDADAASPIEQHIKDCARCQDELKMLTDFLEATTEEPIASNIIPLRTPNNVQRATIAQVSGNLALKGSDNQTSHDAKVGSASIFLESSATPKGFLITGQILDSQVNWVGAVAEAWQADTLQRISILDESCEFRFELTNHAPINLYITSSGGITLVLENITVQP